MAWVSGRSLEMVRASGSGSGGLRGRKDSSGVDGLGPVP
eukprot:CAMPEP_0178395512 /NCGR_PEP_ID=MMETSP0689_2-20121128/13257_1 /TAXON_ID=160604 /ORGANISM="Amphidinium massartii, Strain CS-259" /LENGTH=38 /DNA_ID= /DNA_START= /DNA_END= /DNA_ORIENTATION=